MRKDEIPTARRGWQAVEADQWKALAGEVRKLGVQVPIAGGSHWKRDHDYNAAQAAPGLDLIDDRLYYAPPSWAEPDRRSPSGPATAASPASPTGSGSPTARTSSASAPTRPSAPGLALRGGRPPPGRLDRRPEDWDALVRRGVFLFPRSWGEAAAGTGGGEDIFAIPEVINGIPQTFALLPHAASILHPAAATRPSRPPKPGRFAPAQRGLAGWSPRTAGCDRHAQDPGAGRLDRRRRGEVRWPERRGGRPVRRRGRSRRSGPSRSPRAAASWSPPSAGSSRPASGRSTSGGASGPTPASPPCSTKPSGGSVTWNRAGTVKAYALDNAGDRVGPAPVEKVAGGRRLTIDPRTPSLHWELVVE